MSSDEDAEGMRMKGDNERGSGGVIKYGRAWNINVKRDKKST